MNRFDGTVRAPNLPKWMVDVADAVNLLWNQGQLPKDVHYALITDENRKRFLETAGPFMDHIPPQCAPGMTGVFLWTEVPGHPFKQWSFVSPSDLIVGALSFHLGKTAWGV